ncbi:MAG: hypothetical protein ACREXU_14335 [Gammaproteobacteria bacterium]
MASDASCRNDPEVEGRLSRAGAMADGGDRRAVEADDGVREAAEAAADAAHRAVVETMVAEAVVPRHGEAVMEGV